LECLKAESRNTQKTAYGEAHLLQAMSGDKQRKYYFYKHMLNRMDEDEDFLGKFVFGDEATFNISGFMNRHKYQNHLVIVQHECNSLKLNIFCAPSVSKIYTALFHRQK
jgi:hypothetical protein